MKYWILSVGKGVTVTFSLFGGGALETELNLTMKSAVVGVIITSVTDGWDGGSKKKKKPTKNVQVYHCRTSEDIFTERVLYKVLFSPYDNEGKRGENKMGEYFPAYSITLSE